MACLNDLGLVYMNTEYRFMTDIINYSGTTCLDLNKGKATIIPNICWFMNGTEDGLYFADQLNDHQMSKLLYKDFTTHIILNKPVSQIKIYLNRIYYIDRNDEQLYSCDLNGNNVKRFSHERVDSFELSEEGIQLTTNKGIFSYAYSGHFEKQVTGEFEKLFSELSFIPTAYIPIGEYVYCINDEHNRSLYRVDMKDGSTIRLSNKSSSMLHGVSSGIYFLCSDGWHYYDIASQSVEQVINSPKPISL